MRLVCLIVAFSLVASSAELPVRQVVLYKNGLGYFERGGELARGETARLDFRADEMNDVLKSLTVRDASGGTVAGVRYDSSDPLEKKLGEFPFRLAGGGSMVDFLDQMKGARVETTAAAGVILGSRKTKAAQGEEREQLTLLTDEGVMRSFDLSALPSLKFADAALQAQLRAYLGTLTASRSKDKKSVYIDSLNDKARNLGVSYIAPTPVWKSSYRLIFGAAGDPMLEGWAIVDNTSGEDWTNVRLSLVSGRPVSFLSRLYEPRYARREFVELAEADVARPKVYEGGMAPMAGLAGGVGGGVMGGIAGGVPGGVPPPSPKMEMMMRAGGNRAFAASDSMAMAPSSVATTTIAAKELGELFEYGFSAPVTVKRNESAMLPFVSQKIAARKLLIWTEGINPRNAAELTNSMGKTLDGGPITVFDGGAYAGEALVETVKQGDKRLISYAVDQGTRVSTAEESGEDLITQVKASQGLLNVTKIKRRTTSYKIRNVDAKAKTLILEHPLHADSKVVGAAPAETTDTARRFQVALRPQADETFRVVEDHTWFEETSLSALAPDQFVFYAAQRGIGDAARRQLQALAEKAKAVGATARDRESAQKQTADLERDQTRVRENIRSLNAVSGQQELVQRYAQQLSTAESKLVALRDRISELRQQQEKLQAELDAAIGQLSF
ncbi:MAG: hypothetical protein NTV70_13055 [Acidobacteria bacterium]|nr:hypothetical protein [Acidobacteriota bacterium]